MIKKMRLSLLFLMFLGIKSYAQIDSLNTKGSYWEDQLYFGITYNVLLGQPEGVEASNVSYGFSAGYIKDIPLNKEGTIAFGAGLGYSYDLYTHGLVVDDTSFFLNSEVNSNRFKTSNIEVPLQFRWRTSDAVTYAFWRVYFGVRVSYNFFNRFQYSLSGEDFEFTNLDTFNKFQTGLELSAGYGAFNFYAYYGLSPVFKDAFLDNERIDTKILKVGLIFYLL